MSASVELDYILVCDDIRQEVGKKPSLMGVFTDDILVQGFPATFPKFCFFVHFSLNRKIKEFLLDASFDYPGRKKDISLAKRAKIKVGKGKGGILSFVLAPLVFEKSGHCTFKLTIGKKKYTRTFSVKSSHDKEVFQR